MKHIAIVGFGNVGKCAYEALLSSPDMRVRCIVEMPETPVPAHLHDIWVTDLESIRSYGDVDCAILCLPSRMCPDAAAALMKTGICTVDAYDIHTEIWDVKCRLDEIAKTYNVAGIISAGWDPGSDSILRALMEAMAPRGISTVDFGPGMSMGHSVAAKAIEGVKNALSMTMPTGAGIHRRMVYVEITPGASIEKVTQAILADPYFAHDETHVEQVHDVNALLDMGHGVHIKRKGVSGDAHNQIMEFSMSINNPALTGQMLVSAARAATKQAPGCYTLIEIPVIDMLPGEKQALVTRLV